MIRWLSRVLVWDVASWRHCCSLMYISAFFQKDDDFIGIPTLYWTFITTGTQISGVQYIKQCIEIQNKIAAVASQFLNSRSFSLRQNWATDSLSNCAAKLTLNFFLIHAICAALNLLARFNPCNLCSYSRYFHLKKNILITSKICFYPQILKKIYIFKLICEM